MEPIEGRALKAIDRSRDALDLVDRLIKEMDGLDDSPLGALVAARLGEAIGLTQHLDCPDEAANRSVLARPLSSTGNVQYDNWRTIVKG